MKFNIPSKSLQTQLQALSKVINTKNALSILDNFLFEVKGNELTITGSDQENTLKARVEIMDSEADGEIAINAKRLLDMLKEVPDQGLCFEIDDESKAIEIKFMNGHFSFMGVNAAEYPRTVTDSDTPKVIELPAQTVLKGIENTLFAISTDTLRPIMMGICWDIHPDDVTFVSSDTHKLVRYINRECAPGVEMRFVMPGKPAGILRGLIGKEEENVRMTITERNATIEVGSYALTCRFINGRYPEYNRVIPTDSPYTLNAERSSLLNATRRVSLFASQASSLLIFDIKQYNILLQAQDLDYSVGAEENVACEYDGPNMTIGFKSNFVVEILNNLKSDQVDIRLSDPARPGIFQPVVSDSEEPQKEEILMLIMPMQTLD